MNWNTILPIENDDFNNEISLFNEGSIDKESKKRPVGRPKKIDNIKKVREDQINCQKCNSLQLVKAKFW